MLHAEALFEASRYEEFNHHHLHPPLFPFSASGDSMCLFKTWLLHTWIRELHLNIHFI